MNRTTRPRRWPWIAALALLLQGAVPALAAAASRWQGVPLVEVCTLYGVAWVALDDEGAAAGPAAHGDRCALVSMGSGPPVAPAQQPLVRAAPPEGGLAPQARATARDATAAWQSRLAHAPPSRH